MATLSKMVVPRRFDCKQGDIVDGKYRIQNELGSGAFGCVYKVSDANGSTLALKLLRLWDVPSDIRQQLIDRFEMEFQTGRIADEHLVHSLDFGFLEGNPYIVMEFCSGGDLKSKTGAPMDELVGYAKDVLWGLKSLHINGKVHRDLKPENVLIKSNGVAALTDFGISGDRNKRMTERNIFGKPYQIFGTYAYMPPEQVNRARGETTVLPTTDIFSFGVVMYQLITGDLPFGHLEDQNDLVRYQKRGKAGEWDRLKLYSVPNGREWEAMIDGCLQPNYKQRLQSVDDVVRLLPRCNSQPRHIVEQPIDRQDNNDLCNGFRLRVMQGEEYGRVYDLTKLMQQSNKRLVTVGRDTSNMVCLKEYETAYTSRKHFTMEFRQSNQWIVRDGQWDMDNRAWKSSSNGTYVNSTETTMEGSCIKDKDIISVGEIKLRFEKY